MYHQFVHSLEEAYRPAGERSMEGNKVHSSGNGTELQKEEEGGSELT